MVILPRDIPHPYAGQNAQAFVNIIQTMGQAYTMRQNRMITDNVLAALARGEGAGGMATAAREPIPFSPGLSGFFQKIAAPFAPEPPIKQMMAGQAIGQAFRTITPSQQIAGFRLQNIKVLKAKVEAGTATAEDMAELKRLVGPAPLVQFGKDWEADVVGEVGLADERKEKHRKLTQPSQSIRSGFRAEAIKILGSMPKAYWGYGMKFAYNYDRKRINSAYSEYLNQTGYKDSNEEYRKAIRGGWEVLMGRIKKYGIKIGENKIGKDEIDWDPKDPEVQELEKTIGLKAETAGTPDEETAHRIIYDAWDQLPRKLQDAIRLKEQKGEKYADILQYEEVQELLKTIVK